MMYPPNCEIRLHLLLLLAMSTSTLPLLVFGAASNSHQNIEDYSTTMTPCSEGYEIIEDNLLEESEIAKVYKAIQKETGAWVKIKVFEDIKRFYQESNVLYRFLGVVCRALPDPEAEEAEPSCDHFVELQDTCQLSGKPALVIEFVERALSESIKPDETPTEAAAAPPPEYETLPAVAEFKWYAYFLLEAVNTLHSMGIFHLDVKPANLGLAHDGTLKLCDFGYANTHIGSSQYTGTIEYSAPEMNLGLSGQVQELKQVGKMDSWSVGCTIYEIFAGEQLFSGMKLFIDCPAILSSPMGAHCSKGAAYLYIKVGLEATTPEMYMEEENRFKTDCPEIISDECVEILVGNEPHVNMERFTSNTLLRTQRLDPSSTEPGHLVQLLLALLRFDFTERITTGEALTEYGMFQEFR